MQRLAVADAYRWFFLLGVPNTPLSWRIVASVAVGLALSACTSAGPPAPSREAAPEFTLRQLDDQPVSLAVRHGRPALAGADRPRASAGVDQRGARGLTRHTVTTASD